MKTTALISALMLGGLSFAVQSAEPTPFTVQQLVNLNKLHSAAVSHNGKQLVYGVKLIDADGESTSDLYSLDLTKQNAKPVQLTQVKGTESQVQFAPDDQSIFFVASRDGSNQIYQMPLSGGEAKQVTDFPLDVAGYKLANDGKQVVVNMRVSPQCETLQCSADKKAQQAEKQTTGREYTQLMVRHWDTWHDHARNHLFVAQLGDKPVKTAVDITQGLDTETPPKPFSGMEEVTFTPDGKYVVYTAKAPSKDQAWITNYDLWKVPVAGGKAENLTEDNKAWDAHATFSKDGRYMAYLAMSRPGFEADRFRIMLRDTVTGKEKEVAPLWDRSPHSLSFGRDNKTLLATAQDVGQVSVYEINTQFGDVKRIYGLGSNSIVGFNQDNLIISHKSLVEPGDLHKISFEGENLTRLTDVNKEKLAQVKFGEYQQFSFKGWNNEEVFGYWIKPANFKKGEKYPIAFLVHGGPQGSFGNGFSTRWNPQLWAGAGYGVVMVDFHGSTGYGQAFTDSITQDWGGKPLEDLQKGLAAVTEQQKWLDEDNACALGGSYGGYMMNWIQGNWNDGFKCLVNHAGLFDMRSMYYVTEELWFPEFEFGVSTKITKNYTRSLTPSIMLKIGKHRC